MSILNVINPICTHPVYDARTKVGSTNITTTFFTVDDKKAAPLVGVHYPDKVSDPTADGIMEMPGEIKITKKENSKYNEFFIDFVHDEKNGDNDCLMICALPVAGVLKKLSITQLGESTNVELLKVRMAKYGKQDVPVKLVKNDSVDDGTWGFDKILYLIMKFNDADNINFDVTISADHCGRETNADGKYAVTSRTYTYSVNGHTNEATIFVKYDGRTIVDERPVGVKASSLGTCYEINPFVKKDKSKPASNRGDRKPYTTDTKHEFVNKPRFKNSDLKIPPAPDYPKKNKKNRKNKKSRSNYDY